MKDNQLPPASGELRIFFVSTVLHCVSMTALVYLRSNFGYGYLRPKTVFLSVSWAFILYAIYAWVVGDVWRDHRAALWFGIGATTFYCFHLLRSMRREWHRTAEHDNFSGTALLFYIATQLGVSPSLRLDQRCRLWDEPIATLFIAFAFYSIAGEHHLSVWLAFVACCLWIKEILNQWFEKRRSKIHQDILEITADDFNNQPNSDSSNSKPPKASFRKARVNRPRAS